MFPSYPELRLKAETIESPTEKPSRNSEGKANSIPYTLHIPDALTRHT